MKKPKWWTGSWAFKSVLIWFVGFLVWLPIFSRSPNSVAAKVATFVFLGSMLPLMFLYGAGVLADWLLFLLQIYKALSDSLRGLKRQASARASRPR